MKALKSWLCVLVVKSPAQASAVVTTQMSLGTR